MRNFNQSYISWFAKSVDICIIHTIHMPRQSGYSFVLTCYSWSLALCLGDNIETDINQMNDNLNETSKKTSTYPECLVDLWDITFCTLGFWGPELKSIGQQFQNPNECPVVQHAYALKRYIVTIWFNLMIGTFWFLTFLKFIYGFWEVLNILRNLQLTFDCMYCSQK